MRNADWLQQAPSGAVLRLQQSFDSWWTDIAAENPSHDNLEHLEI